MTEEGVDAATRFSNHVWLHDGLDILAVSILLFTFSTIPVTKTILRAAALISLLPAVAIVYSLIDTPFWSPLFLLPAAAALAFAAWGFALASTDAHVGVLTQFRQPRATRTRGVPFTTSRGR